MLADRRRQLRGSCFANDLMLRQRKQTGNADSRVVLDGQLFSIGLRQALDVDPDAALSVCFR